VNDVDDRKNFREEIDERGKSKRRVLFIDKYYVQSYV